MHYYIIISIIAIIVVIQLCFFIRTILKIRKFRRIFPKDSGDYMLEETGIYVLHYNATLKTIVDSMNDYLNNNKSVNDFHLLKDIVDRNCDAKEEEINTQIPVPLYMGLVGTMAGILVGILYLWLSGGIGDLLNTGGGSGADGVEALLGGVALAMISSILGIILTTCGSIKFKTAKSTEESGKHAFLSWIQAKLMPTLSDNVAGAIREMTGNLNNFNQTFAKNTGNLGIALEKVNASYRLQTQLLDSVNKIADKNLTIQNLQLLDALKNSTTEIGTLAEYLQNCNQYLANVKALNDNLALQENRTRAIEGVGEFFKAELKEIESRKGEISKAVGKVDEHLQNVLAKLGKNADNQLDETKKALGKVDESLTQALGKLEEHTKGQFSAFNQTVGEVNGYLNGALKKLKDNADAQFSELQKSTVRQEEILQGKAKEIETLVTELKQLSAIKESFSKFEQATQKQNNKLDSLANAIQALAKAKAEGTNVQIPNSQMPMRKKILICAGSAIGGLILLAFLIANWNSIYSNFIELFRI